MKGFNKGFDVKNLILLIVIVVLIVIIGALVYLYYFGNGSGFLKNRSASPSPEATATTDPDPTQQPDPTPYPVSKTGNTIEDRFPVPDGYERVTLPEGSFAEYLRKYPLKDYGLPAFTYEGKEPGYHS